MLCCIARLCKGFEYNERTVLGVNAASKWAQEIAELNLAAVATPFYKGYKVLLPLFFFTMWSVMLAPSFVHASVHRVADE